MPSLAIVIPYYKIDFFEETLASVAAQTDKRFTLYIGNDASPNDPLPLIRKYFPEGDYRYFDYKDNLGGQNLAMQWERILENVTEEWFQILGDDDMVSENFVAEFHAKYDRFKEVNFIKTRSVVVDDRGQVLTDKGGQIEEGLHSAIEFFFMKKRGDLNTSLSEHLFKNAEYQKVKFKKYPLAWHSDDFILLEIAKHKNSFYFLPTALVSVRMSLKSISGNDGNYIEKDAASALFYKDLLQLFAGNRSTDREKSLLAEILIKEYPTLRAKSIYLQLFPSFKAVKKLFPFYLKRMFLLRKKSRDD